MKLAKLSLAAIVVAGLASSSFAADTLEGAFKEGKVSGALKAYYFDRDVDGSSKGDIFTTGLMLNYVTGSLNGFSLGFTGQASGSPFADGAIGTVDTGKDAFKGDMYGSGAVLSEAYLAYKMKNTTVLVGRMFLDTPLVASSGSRMVKQAFEGAAVINTDLPQTTLIAGYVQKFQARTDGAGNIGEFKKTFGTGSWNSVALEDGAYTLAAINKSIAGLTLTAAYADAIDIIKIGYAEAAYEGTASKFTYGLAAQYYYNNVDSNVAADSNNLWGVKASLGYDAFGAYVAYSKVNNKAAGIGAVVSGLGGGADLAYTASPLNSWSYGNDVEAYKLGATYAVTKNANIGLSYTVNEFSTTENSYTAVEGDYAFEGALKGLGLSVIFEDQGKDASGSELWTKAIYKF